MSKQSQQTQTAQKNQTAQQTPTERMVQMTLRNMANVHYAKKAFTQAVFAVATLAVAAIITTSTKDDVAPPLHLRANNGMQLIEPLKITEHHKSDSEIATFTANTVQSMLSFDWYNSVFQMNKNVDNFTNAGWLSLKENLERSGILTLVQTKRYILTFEPTSTPVVEQKGITELDGVKKAYWAVKMKGKVMYIASDVGSVARTDFAEISLIIVRQSTLESDLGMAIQRTIIKWK